MPLTPSPANQTIEKMEGIVLILSGPSGTGKTTLCQRLMEKLPELSFNVSHTTRSPRENEIDGRDYHFISVKEFQAKLERGDFLEWTNFNGNFYGTSLESIKISRENGNDIILDLDVQGAKNLNKLKFPGIFIFLIPPSIEELKSRLTSRGTESDAIIRQRMERAINEIKECLEYDYILTSNEVEKSVNNIISIFRAEKLKASRFVPESADIQALFSPEELD